MFSWGSDVDVFCNIADKKHIQSLFEMDFLDKYVHFKF